MDPQAELLLRKAQEDRAALAYDLPDSIFGFHAQQAFEKLFKALIASRNARYGRTHDLAALLKQLVALNEGPLPLPYPVLNLQAFAVTFRYDKGGPLDDLERQKMRPPLISCLAMSTSDFPDPLILASLAYAGWPDQDHLSW